MRKLFGKMLLLMTVYGVIAHGALVDDFEGYEAGNVKTGVTNGAWTAIGNTSFATIASEEDNQYLTSGGYAYGYRGCYGGVDPISDDVIAVTVFARIYAGSDNVNHSFGLSDVAAPTDGGGFGSFEVQMALLSNDTAGSVDFAVRNGSNLERTAISTEQWYNVWAVIDQTTDSYTVYINSGLSDATVIDIAYSGASFRNGTTDDLVNFMVYGGYADNVFRVDDIYITDGESLANPVPEPATCLLTSLGMAMMLKRRK